MTLNSVWQRITSVQCSSDLYSESMHTSAQCLRGGVFAPSSVTALSFILPQMSFTACHWIRRGEAADKNRIAALKHQRGCTKQFSFAGECNYLHRAADEIETFSHPPTSPVTWALLMLPGGGACLCGGVDMCVGVCITA